MTDQWGPSLPSMKRSKNVRTSRASGRGVTMVKPQLNAAAGSISLKDRGLSDEDVPDGPSLVRMMPPDGLWVVDISSNSLTHWGVERLLHPLKMLQCLRVLKLYKNDIGDPGARILAELCRESPHVTELHLSHNNFTAAGANKIVLAGSFPNPRNLNRDPLWLRLERNEVEDPEGVVDNWVGRGWPVCLVDKDCWQCSCRWGAAVHLPYFMSQNNKGAAKTTKRASDEPRDSGCDKVRVEAVARGPSENRRVEAEDAERGRPPAMQARSLNRPRRPPAEDVERSPLPARPARSLNNRSAQQPPQHSDPPRGGGRHAGRPQSGAVGNLRPALRWQPVAAPRTPRQSCPTAWLGQQDPAGPAVISTGKPPTARSAAEEWLTRGVQDKISTLEQMLAEAQAGAAKTLRQEVAAGEGSKAEVRDTVDYACAPAEEDHIAEAEDEEDCAVGPVRRGWQVTLCTAPRRSPLAGGGARHAEWSAPPRLGRRHAHWEEEQAEAEEARHLEAEEGAGEEWCARRASRRGRRTRRGAPPFAEGGGAPREQEEEGAEGAGARWARMPGGPERQDAEDRRRPPLHLEKRMPPSRMRLRWSEAEDSCESEERTVFSAGPASTSSEIDAGD